MGRFHEIMFTEDVIDSQILNTGSGRRRAAAVSHADPSSSADRDSIGPEEAEFLLATDGMYIATTGSTGWPYVQFRGGSPGFINIPDEHHLCIVEMRGNRQYISTGNLAGNNRLSAIVLDYASRRRLKILGFASIHPLDQHRTVGMTSEVIARASSSGGIPERLLVVEVVALNWNCPQYIPQKFNIDQVRTIVNRIRTEDGGNA